MRNTFSKLCADLGLSGFSDFGIRSGFRSKRSKYDPHTCSNDQAKARRLRQMAREVSA